jgi:hypothetical protein
MRMEALTSLCPSGFWFVRRFCESRSCSSHSCFSPFLSCLDSSIWVFWFILFDLRWTRMWVDPFHRRILSNSSWVHRSGLSNFWGGKLVFSTWFGFPIDCLNFERWSLRGSSPIALWSTCPNLVAIDFDLDTNWVVFGWRRFSRDSFLHGFTTPGQSGV